jgi:hypothetical protein
MWNFDHTSVGLCSATIFLNALFGFSMHDAPMILTGIAAITTILYNIQKMIIEWRKK